jgi:hypothetical protein
MRLLLLLPFIICNAFALDCGQYSRAVVTDQKNMATDVALQYLQVDKEKVTRLEVKDYVSWKENQKGCLADVIHYAKIEIDTIEGEKRCSTTMDLHTKDDFTSSVQFEREYKVRNVQKECEEQTATQALQCQQTPRCPREGGSRLVKDYQDECKCKFFDQIVLFEDTGDLYDNFFSVLNLIKKPAELFSPFSK